MLHHSAAEGLSWEIRVKVIFIFLNSQYRSTEIMSDQGCTSTSTRPDTWMLIKQLHSQLTNTGHSTLYRPEHKLKHLYQFVKKLYLSKLTLINFVSSVCHLRTSSKLQLGIILSRAQWGKAFYLKSWRTCCLPGRGLNLCKWMKEHVSN